MNFDFTETFSMKELIIRYPEMPLHVLSILRKVVHDQLTKSFIPAMQESIAKTVIEIEKTSNMTGADARKYLEDLAKSLKGSL